MIGTGRIARRGSDPAILLADQLFAAEFLGRRIAPELAPHTFVQSFGERLGLKHRIATHWALNPHPTLIPAIESGWVKQIHSFGSEVGMDDYIRARPDIFFTGSDGSLRSNRAFCQTAGLYACDMFIGSTLQIDLNGNSSTVTANRCRISRRRAW